MLGEKPDLITSSQSNDHVSSIELRESKDRGARSVLIDPCSVTFAIDHQEDGRDKLNRASSERGGKNGGSSRRSLKRSSTQRQIHPQFITAPESITWIRDAKASPSSSSPTSGSSIIS